MSHLNNDDYWNTVRSNYSITLGLSYFDNAKFSPPPKRVLTEVDSWHHSLANNPASPMRLPELELARVTAAKFIGAHANEIALTRSATEGVSLVLNGFSWHKGDEIIFDNSDHPNTVSTLNTLEQRHGIRAVSANVDWYEADDDNIVERYASAFTENTRLLYLSHLNSATGRVLPIKAIAQRARAHGVLTLLDANQSLGVLNYSVADLDVDYLVAAGHKWLAAGYGGGLAYFKQSAQEPVWPTLGGFFDPTSNTSLPNSVRRYDSNAGQKNVPSLLGFTASLNYQNHLGRDVIQSRISELTTVIKNGVKEIDGLRLLTPENTSQSGGMVNISLTSGKALSLHSRLIKDRNIYVGTHEYGHETVIRISPHIYNSTDEINKLLNAIKSAAV